MLEEFVEGECYFRVIGGEEKEREVQELLEKAGIRRAEIAKENNQYRRFETGTYHFKGDFSALVKLAEEGYIVNIEKVPIIRAADKTPQPGAVQNQLPSPRPSPDQGQS